MKRRIDLDIGWVEGDLVGQVQIGDRLVSRIIRAFFPGADDQPELTMTIDSSSGVPRCTELCIRSTEGRREVRTTDVRAVEIDNWIEAIVPLFAHQVVGTNERGGQRWVQAIVREPNSDAEDFNRARAVVRQARRAGRRKVTDDLLRRVAEVYAGQEQRSAEAVELAFGVSTRTAFRYISLARERGFLPLGGQ